MPSLFALSTYALSDIEDITFVPEALRRLATARTADPIVFLEISARENVVTTLEDVLQEPPGTYINPLSSLPISARELPRTQRDTVTFLFATRPWAGRPDDTNRPNERALPRLLTGGRITRSVPIEATIQKRGQRTIGDAVISNPDGALDYLLTNYSLTGGFIKAWLAEPDDDTGDWALVYEATIDEVEATRKEIRISITTIADQLERSLQLRKYSGGGGYNGDASVAGRLRPTCWGECYGVDPVLFDPSNNCYQVHDGPIQAVDAVMEGGLPYVFTADYSNYENLIAASLATGEYATCLSLGLFRIGTTLAGLVFPIRANIKGDARQPGYVSATGDILYRIARDRAFVPAISVNVSAFNGLPRGRVGYYSNGASDTKVSEVFDALLGGVVAVYGVGRTAKITVSRMLPAEFFLDDLNVKKDQIFDVRVENRPFIPRIVQPYTYSPTFATLDSDQVSTSADPTTASRLQNDALSGEVFQTSDAAVPVTPQPPLVTYFVDENAARAVASNALLFAAQNIYPLRIDLGRIGLTADIGKVMAIDEARFATDWRGVIYEQEDNLGAVVTSRVVALG